MDGKQQIVTGLMAVFTNLQTLLDNLSEEQIIAPMLPDEWSVKDKIAHLWAWQQASVARMEAALEEREPAYPEWWTLCGPDPEQDVDRTNAWLYQASQDKPWSRVYDDWKTQFQYYVQLTRQIAEEDLLQLGRYSWMGAYALSASSMGSLEHHVEHFEDLQSWLIEHGYLDTKE